MNAIGKAGFVIVFLVSGCSLLTPKNILSAADYACLTINQELADEEALKACKIEHDLSDIAQQFLVTERKATGVAMARKACKP